MMLSRLFFIILVASLFSCSGKVDDNKEEIIGLNAIEFCIKSIESITDDSLSNEVNSAHVEIFEGGYMVGFTHGEAGSFGERDPNYKMIIACGVSIKHGSPELVVLRSPVAEDYYYEPDLDDYSDFSQDVLEVLFFRVDGKFEYCCSQPFGEDNIRKNNPDLPWWD